MTSRSALTPEQRQRIRAGNQSWRSRRVAAGLCAYCGLSREDGYAYACARCQTAATARGRAVAARSRFRDWRPGINVALGSRTYLAGDLLHPENKAGRSKQFDARIAQISKACGYTLQLLAWHPDRNFERHVLDTFGRRDPFYDGDGKTEWPDADLLTLLAFYEDNGGHIEFDADRVFDQLQRKAIHLPETLQVEKFEVYTDIRQVKEYAA